jgi:hypothetical protein
LFGRTVNEAQLLRLHIKFKSIADSEELLLLSTLCCQPEVVLVPFFSIYTKLFMQQLQPGFTDPHVTFVAFAQVLSAFFILAPAQHKRTGELGSADLICIALCILHLKLTDSAFCLLAHHIGVQPCFSARANIRSRR